MDYRKSNVAALITSIKKFGKAEEDREEVLNGLLKVAVWHTIKDGQIPPAGTLLAVARGDKERVAQYLTKFGNLTLSKEKGLAYSKAKGKVQYGPEKADEVFENLPTLEEAFPQHPKQYKDVPFLNTIRAILNRAKTLQEHDHKFVFSNEDEQKLYDQMQGLVAKAA